MKTYNAKLEIDLRVNVERGNVPDVQEALGRLMLFAAGCTEPTGYITMAERSSRRVVVQLAEDVPVKSRRSK